MKVRSGAVSNGRSIEVELDSSWDIPDGWSGLGPGALFEKMTAKADLLIVKYMKSEGLMPVETADKRLADIAKALSA